MAFFGLKSDIFRSFSSNLKIEYSSGASPKMSCQPRQRRFFSPDRAPGVCVWPQKRRIPGRLRGPRRRIPPPSHAVNARDARRTLCLLAPTAPFAKGSCQHAVLTEGSDSIRRRRLVILRENKIRARSLRPWTSPGAAPSQKWAPTPLIYCDEFLFRFVPRTFFLFSKG